MLEKCLYVLQEVRSIIYFWQFIHPPSLMFLNSFFHLIFFRSRTRSYRVLSSCSNVLISMTLFRKKTLPCYKAPNDFLFNIVKTQQLTSGGWDCPLNNGPKLVVEQPNRSSSGFCPRVLTVPYLCQWHALTCELKFVFIYLSFMSCVPARLWRNWKDIKQWLSKYLQSVCA